MNFKRDTETTSAIKASLALFWRWNHTGLHFRRFALLAFIRVYLGASHAIGFVLANVQDQPRALAPVGCSVWLGAFFAERPRETLALFFLGAASRKYVFTSVLNIERPQFWQS